MSGTFLNHVVLITGASRGIGWEMALEFARQGAAVALAARSETGLRQVAREITEAGGTALVLPTDITSGDAVREMVASTLGGFGRIDVLVNNAGIARVGRVEDRAFVADVEATMQASLFGMIGVIQAVLPTMRLQGSGTIVNMSSVMGRKAFARFGSYAIVMHAVAALSDALRQELSGTGIGVTLILPALTVSDLLRDVKPDEMPPPFWHLTPLPTAQVARAVAAAVHRRRPRAVVPGRVNLLLLGEALSPRIGDWMARALARGGLARLLRLSTGKTYHEAIG